LLALLGTHHILHVSGVRVKLESHEFAALCLLDTNLNLHALCKWLPLFFLNFALLFRNMATVCTEMTALCVTMMLVTREGRLGYNSQLHTKVSVNLCHISIFNVLLNVAPVQS